jgi:hypothetical protein
MLPRIPAIESQTEQPKPTTEFPDWYLSLLVMRSSPENTRATIKLQPYNYDEGVLSTELPPLTVEVSDLMSEAGRVPALAQAMGAILQVTTFLGQEKYLLSKIEKLNTRDLTEEEQQELTNLEQQLETLRTQAGVANE